MFHYARRARWTSRWQRRCSASRKHRGPRFPEAFGLEQLPGTFNEHRISHHLAMMLPTQKSQLESPKWKWTYSRDMKWFQNRETKHIPSDSFQEAKATGRCNNSKSNEATSLTISILIKNQMYRSNRGLGFQCVCRETACRLDSISERNKRDCLLLQLGNQWNPRSY